MQGNRSRDTKPELIVRRKLHAAGLRYRVSAYPVPELRHKVDIVFRPIRVAVEVRGCFWHGCAQHYRQPTVNSDYWAGKIARNIARDDKTDTYLRSLGWLVIVIWEHEDLDLAARSVTATVRRLRDNR
jgi:DNA mismatch endonuclease (patch repair protein)